jgi:hypothetical protein
MGLSIEVGYLADMLDNDEEGATWFRDNLAQLNLHLRASGLAPHQEPETCPVFSADMFGYSGLHYLRRAAAHLSLRGSLPPPGGKDASDDPVLAEYYDQVDQPRGGLLGRVFSRQPLKRKFEHLILHSDAEGYYVPQDFPEVLFPPEELKIPGGMVGSSQRLLQEMTVLAEALQLPPGLDPEADEVWQAADSQGTGEAQWQRYGVESYVCLRLLRAAQHSIANSALIVFC